MAIVLDFTALTPQEAYSLMMGAYQILPLTWNAMKNQMQLSTWGIIIYLRPNLKNSVNWGYKAW